MGYGFCHLNCKLSFKMTLKKLWSAPVTASKIKTIIFIIISALIVTIKCHVFFMFFFCLLSVINLSLNRKPNWACRWIAESCWINKSQSRNGLDHGLNPDWSTPVTASRIKTIIFIIISALIVTIKCNIFFFYVFLCYQS